MLVALAACLAAGHAHAQGVSDRAVAESLSLEGRALMDAGTPERACPKFAESERLEASVGTLLNLGACYEALGKTASAWAEFSRALALAKGEGDAERAALADRRMRALEGRLALVNLQVVAVDGMKVEIDGEGIGSSAWNNVLPLDPGSHTLQVSAPSHESWTTSFELAPGPSRVVVTVPALKSASEPAKSTRPPNVSTQTPSVTEPAPSSPRYGFWTAVGVSGVAFAVGTIAWLDYRAQARLLDEHCDGRYCDARGIKADERARTLAPLADVSFGVGVASAVVAGLLWYSTSSQDDSGIGLAPMSIDGIPLLGTMARY